MCSKFEVWGKTQKLLNNNKFSSLFTRHCFNLQLLALSLQYFFEYQRWELFVLRVPAVSSYVCFHKFCIDPNADELTSQQNQQINIQLLFKRISLFIFSFCRQFRSGVSTFNILGVFLFDCIIIQSILGSFIFHFVQNPQYLSNFR